MTIRKIKNPVEYCFLQWINGYPDSAHYTDKEKFFRFVKAVTRHSAKKWHNRHYLKDRILTIRPSFDPDFLEARVALFYVLLDFQLTKPLVEMDLCSSKEVTDGYYIEIRVKDGQILEVEVPLVHFRTNGKPVGKYSLTTLRR